MVRKPSFEFRNQVAPRYIEPLFVHLGDGAWHLPSEMRDMLRHNGIDVVGEQIVQYNITTWSLIGLGRTQRGGQQSKTGLRFQVSPLGNALIEQYSTNRPLFFDLMHFLFYTTWLRSQDIYRGRFWTYMRTCQILWEESPKKVDTFEITNRLLQECQAHPLFAEYHPTFPERSVSTVCLWMKHLDPPVIRSSGRGDAEVTARRSYCTPQLFQLALDVLYHDIEHIAYSSSMGISEALIDAVCRITLLDPASFWEMAKLAEMSLDGIEIRQGQWGTSIALAGPVQWITLPAFEQPGKVEIEEEDEEV